MKNINKRICFEWLDGACGGAYPTEIETLILKKSTSLEDYFHNFSLTLPSTTIVQEFNEEGIEKFINSTHNKFKDEISVYQNKFLNVEYISNLSQLINKIKAFQTFCQCVYDIQKKPQKSFELLIVEANFLINNFKINKDN